MVNKIKETVVAELADKLKANTSVVLTEYQGLTVAEISELRSKLRPLKCEYKVVKNTLTKRALNNLKLDEFSQFFTGPSAIAIDNTDPVATAKVLVDFSKEHNKLKVKAGLMDGKILSLDDIKNLASLPSREVLLSKVFGTMQAPISGFVNVLAGTIRSFYNVVNAIKENKEKENK